MKSAKKQTELFDGILALPSFPVVLVTVERNIMTAAAFHFYSFEPPSIMVGVIPENLTCELIKAKGEFGINIPTTDQIDIADICGSVSGRSEDKFHKAGLTPMKGKIIESFLVKECPVNLECKVVHEIDHPGTHRWFIGEIKAVHIDTDYSRNKALMFWLNEFRSVGEVLLKDVNPISAEEEI